MPPKSPRIRYRKLGRERAHGLWVRGNGRDEVWLDSRLKGRHKLTVAIHELLHSIEPDWSESRVQAASQMISHKLWEMGFRWVDNRTR